MSNLSIFIQNRRKESYQKLTSRFLRSLKQGSFSSKTKRQRRHLIERIKCLESQLGFRSNLKLKHWALAAALGLISVTGYGQDKEEGNKKFFQRENAKREIQEANKQTSVFKTDISSSASGIAAIPIFEPQPFLGDPISHPIESYGDIDNDGDQDLLITSYFGVTKILLNDGNGSFGNELTVRNGASSGAGVYYQETAGMADMDGDGDIDIFLLENGYNNGSSITNLVVLENDGNASFAERLTGLTIGLNGSPHLADIDSDGDIDIITGFSAQDGSYSAITTLVNNGTNGFTNIGAIDNTNNAELTIGDIDGDGDIDITLFSYENRNLDQYPYFVQLNVIKSFTNNGAGIFEEQTYELAETEFSVYPYDGVLSGDIVGSEAPDLVVVYNNSIVAFVNEGNSTFSVDTIFYDGPQNGITRSFDKGKLVDFDLDGDLDISVEEQYFNSNTNPYLYLRKRTFLENTNGIFTLSSIDVSTNIGENTDSVLPIDIDGDSDIDLIASNGYDIVVHKNDGVGNFSTFEDDLVSVVYGIGASIVADLDGDGDQDILNSGLTMVLINDGSGNLSIGQNIVRESGMITYLVESGDLDDDGDIDFVSTLNNNTEGIITFLNDGNATFLATDTVSVGLSQIKLGDLDQDGDLDIVGSGYGVDATYYLHTFLNDGNGNFTTGQSIGYSYEIDDALLVVDIDNDNDPDVIAGGANGIIIVENLDGSFGDFVAHFENQDNVGFDRLASGDLDGDGDVDIFANNEEYENGAFDYFLINDGSGLFQELQSSIQTTGYGGSIIEDFDLDGDLDVYVGGGEENEDELWTNDGFANFSLAGTTGTTLYNPVAGDMDGDGDMDVFGTEYYQSSRLIINTTNQPQSGGPNIIESDSLALVAIFDALNGTEWTTNDGWEIAPASEWHGVSIDENLRVSGISLPNNNLSGKLDQGLFANLTGLSSVNLSGNELTGSIPSEFFSIELTQLTLSNNKLSGELPSLPNEFISTLESFEINDNALYGKLPSGGSYPVLQTLRFENNLFEGELLLPFSTMTNLKELVINDNELSGELPSSLGDLESLQFLQISNNLLSGSIPDNVMSIGTLQSVDISSNEISGSIGGFANAQSLTQLKANNNRIDDLAGLETTVAQVNVTENALDFGDFQSLGETLPQNFLIDPQSFLFDPIDSTHNVGEPIILSYEIGGTGNVYQWFKNGEELAEATSNSIEFESPDTDQEGTYVLRITNPQYEELELLTSPFVLKIGSLERDKAALLDLLENVEGFTPDNWGEANALDNTWEGVTLSTNGLRVERLELPAALDKVWKGVVPESFIDMTGLQVIELIGHELNSFPNISSFPNLQTLDIRGNRLAFLHIVPNLRISDFEYAPQRRYGETTYDTLDAGENILLEIEDMGRGSVYEWKFAPLIPGQRFNNEVVEVKGTSSRLVIEDINFSNQGTYRVFATHPLATELTIESRNQNVLAKTDLFGTITLDGEPLTTGGDVFVYRQTPSGPFVKEDSTTIGESGVYGVRDVVLGNFVVQVKPDRSENDDLLQTYYISSENYREADTLKLRDEIDGIDIEILTFDEGDEGTAQIGGFIESDFDDEPIDEEEARIEARRKVKKAGCAMRRFKAQGRDEQDEVETEIAYYIETDDEGYFNFEGVESGRYLINIEFPGVPMDESSDVEFIIDENKENQVFDVNVLIDEAGISVDAEEVLFNWKPYVKDIVVYPNPTDGVVDLDYLVYRDVSDLKIQVLSIQGTLLFDKKLSHSRGNHRAKLDLTKYESGVYFLVFTDELNTFKHELKVTRK